MASYPSVASPERRSAGRQGDDRGPTGDLLALLRRRSAWIVIGALLALVLALPFLALASPHYTAVVELLINPNGLQVADNATAAPSTPGDATVAQVDNQLRVMTSDNVLRKVIADLHLDHDPEFANSTSGARAALDRIAERHDRISFVPERDAAVVARKNLSTAIVARRRDRAYVVELSVTTSAPEKSARIANAIVKAYLADLDAARTDALSGRLQDLKDRVHDAEDRSERYKAEHNIVVAAGQPASGQQLTDLSNQLTAVTTRVEAAKARLEQIERLKRPGADPIAISEVAQSPVLAALRAQYTEVLGREAELATQLGPRHPSMIDVKEQARDLRRAIDREVGRLAEAARGDYGRSRATQESLERRLATLKRDAASTSQALAQLRELEREAETSRAIYQAFLTLSRETSEQERLSVANVRVLSEANLPAKRSWPPNSILVLAAALAFGAAGGAGLGAIRSRGDDRIHSRRDLEAVCQLPILAAFPGNPKDCRQEDWRTRMLAKARAHRQGVALVATLLDAPKSSFAAGIHRLVDVLHATGPNGGPRATAIMAAGAPGARSDVALNLALAAASNPKRVLLVDADLSRRELSSRVLGGNGDGMLDVADQRVELDNALIAEPRTGLMLLQAGHAAANADRPVDPDLVVKILDRARGGYSIVIDAPSDRFDPLGPALAAAVDSIILVVTAGLTRARDIAEFERTAALSAGKLRGIVFVSRSDGIT